MTKFLKSNDVIVILTDVIWTQMIRRDLEWTIFRTQSINIDFMPLETANNNYYLDTNFLG